MSEDTISRETKPKQPRRFGWGWIGVAIALAVAVAGMAAWNAQRVPEKSPQASAGRESSPRPAFKPDARSPENARLPPRPAVMAEPPQGSIPDRPPRDRVDRPGDENPGLEQLRRAAEQEFRAADADGDGFLSRDEARHFPVLARDFERTDADGDGRISVQEFVRLRRLQARERPQK
ncbi:MAG TPA: EF-hand domain-containing protein [Burkholderiales bacterium]|nr:EF-hand domain-containing protein [Burkholderiales bacterium]